MESVPPSTGDLGHVGVALGASEAGEASACAVAAEVQPADPAEPHHQLPMATETARWSCHSVSLFLFSAV